MKLTKRLAAVVLAAILSLVMLTACTGTLPPDDSGYNSQLILYRQEVLRLINEVREFEKKNNGYVDLEPLTGLTNQNLNAAAQTRAEELATSFTHTRPDNSEWFTVLTEYHVGTYWVSDERIASTSASGANAPSALVTELRFSDAGRQAILNNRYRQVGIGYVETDGQYYWALIFVG